MAIERLRVVGVVLVMIIGGSKVSWWKPGGLILTK